MAGADEGLADAVGHAPTHCRFEAWAAISYLVAAGTAAVEVAGRFAVAATSSGITACRAIANPRPALVAPWHIACPAAARCRIGRAIRLASRDESADAVVA
jgi:hypothetical protein